MALTERAIFSLVIASLHFLAAILITFGLRKWRALPYHELLIILWLVYDAIVHFTLVRSIGGGALYFLCL